MYQTPIERISQMGTRGLTKVIDKDNILKVAQYGQWDHYPEGQGVKILSILTTDRYAVEELELALDKCYFISDTDREVIYNDYNTRYPETTHLKKFSSMLPSFSRDTCGDILNVVRWSAGPVPLVDEREFENDDLFCEGVYTVDYHTNKFISQHGGVTVEFPLDKLPTHEEYLQGFVRARLDLDLREVVDNANAIL
jgi:hypothetical protein